MQAASLTPPPTVTKENYGLIDSNASNNAILNELPKPKLLLPSLKSKSAKPFHLLRKNKLESNSILDLNYVIENNLHSNIDIISNNARKCHNHTELHKLQFLKSVLQNCSNMIVITGAGISTDCGIPDFRSNSKGLFKKDTNNKYLLDSTNIYSSIEQTLKFNNLISSLYNLSQLAIPTPFHKLLDFWTQNSKIRRIYTQNIDSIENKLSSFKDVNIFRDLNTAIRNKSKLVPLHGTINFTQCNKCFKVEGINIKDFPITTNDNNNDNNVHSLIPICLDCKETDEIRQIAGLRSRGVGQLRPKIVLYNEPHPDGEIIAEMIKSDLNCKLIDCLLIVGTTLQIPGVKEIVTNLVNLKKRQKLKKLVIIFVSNELPNRKIMNLFGDDGIDMIVHGNCQDLAKVVDPF